MNSQAAYPHTTANVGALNLTFQGTADRTSEYTVTPAPGNPTFIDPGTTATFTFDVDAAYDRLFSDLLLRPQDAWLHVSLDTVPLKRLQLAVGGWDSFMLPWTLAEVRLFHPEVREAEDE